MKKLTIPIGLNFADLELEITDDGALRYLPAPLGEFALLNGIDPDLVGDEDLGGCRDFRLVRRIPRGRRRLGSRSGSGLHQRVTRR